MTPSTLRASSLQALSFGAVGAIYPFLALELTGAGIGGAVLFAALVASPALRLGLGPAWGWVADRLGGVRAPLWISACIAALGLVAILAGPAWLVLLGAVILAAGRSGLGPLIETASLSAVGHDPGRYGNVRRWGSLGFALAVVLASLGRDYVAANPLWLGLALTGLFLLVSLSLPRTPASASRPRAQDWWALARSPLVLATLLTSALHFSGIVLYDAFFAMHLQANELPTSWLGASIGLGIGVEIVVLSLGGLLLRHLGARWLLVLAVAIHLPRWTITALGTDPAWLIPIQAVHGFAFGGYWLASIALLTERASDKLAGSAQGLLAASAGGVGALMGNAIGAVLVEHATTASLFWTALGMSVAATAVALGIAATSSPDRTVSRGEAKAASEPSVT